jgi:uncharacterized protein YciI
MLRVLLMFFTTGAKSAASVPKEELERLQQAHIANLERLYKEGTTPLAGPCADPGKRRRGIVLLNTDRAGDIPALFRPDPYVSGGFMGTEAHRVEPLALEVGREPAKSIVELSIAIIEERRTAPVLGDGWGMGPQDLEPDLPPLLRLPWAERPRVLLRRADRRAPLFAMGLFPTTDHDAVRRLLEQDEMLRRDGGRRWDVQVWRQWVAKDALRA